MRPAEHELAPPLMRVTSATRLVDVYRAPDRNASRSGECLACVGQRGPLHVQRYAMSGEDRLMHHLGQSGVRKDAVDQIRSRGADGHGYDEPLNQFRDFRPDQVRSDQSIRIRVK